MPSLDAQIPVSPAGAAKAPDLKALLHERGLKLNAIADALGVDKSTLTRWSKKRVPAERVVELSDVTGIPAAAIRPDLTFIDRRVLIPHIWVEIASPSSGAEKPLPPKGEGGPE